LNKKTFANSEFFKTIEESLEGGENVSFLVKGTSNLMFVFLKSMKSISYID